MKLSFCCKQKNFFNFPKLRKCILLNQNIFYFSQNVKESYYVLFQNSQCTKKIKGLFFSPDKKKGNTPCPQFHISCPFEEIIAGSFNKKFNSIQTQLILSLVLNVVQYLPVYVRNTNITDVI